MTYVSTGDQALVEDPAGSGTFVELGEVINVGVPKMAVEDVDVTHQGSGGVKEYEPGLGDLNEIDIEMNWLGGSATDTLLAGIHGAKEVRAWKVVVGGATFAFNAYIKNYQVANSLGEKRTSTVTLRVTDGVVTQT